MRARLALAIATVVILALSAALWHRHKESAALADEMQAYEAVARYLAAGEPSHALELIRNYYGNENESIDWLVPSIQALTQLRDGPALLQIYQNDPKKFDQSEDASLLVAGEFIARGQLDQYGELKRQWQDRAKREAAWFDLKVDALLLQNRREEAQKALKAHSFEGAADVGRLSRLALLQAPDDLKSAWNSLVEARAKDPNNGSLLSARAQIFELTGKPQLARQEYLRAVQKDPSNVFLIDQLGDFYRRHGHYVLAMETWCCGLGLPNSDALWIKTLFWSRVVYPTPIDWTQYSVPVGYLKPLINYLLELNKDQFWVKNTFKQLPNYPQYSATQQAAYWLRLAQQLKEGKEKQAANLLAANPFQHVLWDPQLHKALQQVIAYRIERRLPNPRPDAVTNEDGHHFFRELDQFSGDSRELPAETKNLLLSPYAIPSTFLAAGWLEAALSFPLPDVLPPDLPDWVSFAYTQALRFNRGSQQALDFAAKQKSSPPLQLLMGELKIATGDFDGGLQQLAVLMQSDSDIGLRAAWVSSLIHLQRKQYARAKDTILSQPRLASYLIGKETLARIAMEAGDVAEADRLYQEIEADSIEAKFYLARRAYEQKEWNRAAVLTHQLLEEFPDNPQLKSELIKIKNLDQKLNQKMDKGDLYENTIPIHLELRIDRSVARFHSSGLTGISEPI